MLICFAGVAFACVHGPLMYLNGLYFVKRLSLAQAITVSGFSFGGFIFPPFYSYIIEYYGIRGGMLITGGLLLHVIVLSMFLRPKSSKVAIHTNNHAENNSTSKEFEKPLQTIKKEQLKCDSTPLIYYERERCHSESLPSYYPINHSNGGVKMNAVSELHLHQQELSGSTNKFIDKLSHSNITRVIGESDVISMSLSELRDNRLRSCDSLDTESPSACSQRLKYIFDGRVFKHWFTWLYLFVYCIGSIGSAYVIVFIAPFAKDHSISPNRVASLVSIVNACDFVGRLMNGVITDRKILKNHQSVIITLCVTTLCLALSPFYTHYWHFVVFAIVSGLSAGGIFAMTPSVLVDFIGIENFRSSMGIMVLGQGLTLGLSAPFIGKNKIVKEHILKNLKNFAYLLLPVVKHYKEKTGGTC
jgi:MFS family permease